MNDSRGRRLQEQFGPVRGVDLVVELRGPARFLLAGDLAALVRDARGPDFLAVDGREEGLIPERFGCEPRVDQFADDLARIGMAEQIGERRHLGFAARHRP